MSTSVKKAVLPHIQQLSAAMPQISAYLDRYPTKTLRRNDLVKILEENREPWELSASLVSARQFIDTLLAGGCLKKAIIPSPHYAKQITRYAWRDPSPYDVALSLKTGVYFSHGTALSLHGLTDQLPHVIYINKEQTPKPMSEAPLTQEGITKAFSRPQRSSRYEFVYNDYRILLLSGKNTGQLEVAAMSGPAGEQLPVTKLARTLIDITVRPNYAGGVFQVLTAYERARSQVSINTVLAILKKLNYGYPYHQAIGFYMKKAGYDKQQLERLKAPGLTFDFYLDYAIPEKNREYDSEWRLFFPKGL